MQGGGLDEMRLQTEQSVFSALMFTQQDLAVITAWRGFHILLRCQERPKNKIEAVTPVCSSRHEGMRCVILV